MIKSRHVLMAGVLGFMFLAFGAPKAQAHEWQGDEWAQTAIDFDKFVISCESLLEKSVETFYENEKCGSRVLMTKIENVSATLFDEFNEHPETTPTLDFVTEHFDDVDLGVAGINSVMNAVLRIKRLTHYLMAYELNKMVKEQKVNTSETF